jgi:hypothetical protein
MDLSLTLSLGRSKTIRHFVLWLKIVRAYHFCNWLLLRFKSYEHHSANTLALKCFLRISGQTLPFEWNDVRYKPPPTVLGLCNSFAPEVIYLVQWMRQALSEECLVGPMSNATTAFSLVRRTSEDWDLK